VLVDSASRVGWLCLSQLVDTSTSAVCFSSQLRKIKIKSLASPARNIHREEKGKLNLPIPLLTHF
jgi:hypothetical protein